MDFVKKTNWTNDPSTVSPITATELTRMENGIEEGARDATETQRGNVELATASEMTTGTDLTRVPSVKRVVDYVAATLVSIGGVTEAYVLAAISAPFSLIATSIGMVPLTIKAMVGQTSNLLEFKNPDEELIATIDQNGQITLGPVFTGLGMIKAQARSSSTALIRTRMVEGQSGNVWILSDHTTQTKFSISPEGKVNGLNIGSMPGTSIEYSPLIVLDAAEAVPTETLAGTVILRRPA